MMSSLGKSRIVIKRRKSASGKVNGSLAKRSPKSDRLLGKRTKPGTNLPGTPVFISFRLVIDCGYRGSYHVMKPSEALKSYRTQMRAIVPHHGALRPRVFGSVIHGDDTEGSDRDLY
jgi:hypothetical protein